MPAPEDRRPAVSRSARAGGLALALALGACAADGAVRSSPVPVAAPRVTGTARAADRDHSALVASFGGEYRAPALKALLDEVVARLVPATDRPGESYEATILDSPKVNAFALPSGRLYVTRGLLALASDSSELAAVVAHEIAHVSLRHASLRGEAEARSVLVSRVVSDVLGDPAAGAAFRDQARSSLAGFSRSQEIEADRAGVATIAAAGYDPHAAARFLRSLGRDAAADARDAGGAWQDGLASHPATAERVAVATAAARRVGADGLGTRDRARYLAALDGLAFGDRPADGMVRGRAFLHPRLGVALRAPEGMALENTARALLGVSADGRTRLLFDAVEAPDGQSLQELLAASWTDAIEPGSLRTRLLGDRPVAFAASRGRDWSFRLAALRIGPTTYRLILAGRGSRSDLDGQLEQTLASLRELGPEEAAGLRPLRVVSVEAGPEDTAERLAARMATDRLLDRFLILNGLEPGERLRPGQSYKLVVE